MTDSKSEIEKLSKENFNLKLRLHYFEEQQQQNSSTMSNSPSKPFPSATAEDDAQLQHYRKLVEDAKTIISDLQDTLSQTQEDLLFATNEAEDFRQENAQIKRQLEQYAQQASKDLTLRTDQLAELQSKMKSTEMDMAEMQRELQDFKIMENELAQVKQALRQSKASELEVLELKREVQRLKTAEEDLKRTLQHETELRRDLQQHSRPAATSQPASQELKQAQLEISELKRSLQQAKSSELEVLELRRALQQAKSSEFQVAELKRAQQQAQESQLEVIELRRALRNKTSTPPSRNDGSQEEVLQQRVKQAEARVAALKQALSSQQSQHDQQIQRLLADHEAKLKEKPTSSTWEQAALRFTGTTDCNTLVDFIHDLQTEVREWEVAATEVTGGRIVDPHTLQKLVQAAAPRKHQHNLPSVQRVEMAEDMLREATERLERLEGSRKFKWEDALQRASALERENKRLQAELRKRYNNT